MKENDKRKILKRIIGLCWFSLILCMVVKLFGGNYFEIASKNENFINVCNWIETNFISTVIMYGFYCLSYYLIISIFSRNCIKGKNKIILIIVALFLCTIKGHSNIIGFIIETISMIFLPLFMSKGKKSKIIINCVISYAVINVFQLLSLFIRNIDAQLVNANFCISLLFQVDYYIMLILYYLYSVKLRGEKK